MAARQKEACTLELAKRARNYNEDIIAAYHPPGILERFLAHLHQRMLSSVFMMSAMFRRQSLTSPRSRSESVLRLTRVTA